MLSARQKTHVTPVFQLLGQHLQRGFLRVRQAVFGAFG